MGKQHEHAVRQQEWKERTSEVSVVLMGDPCEIAKDIFRKYGVTQTELLAIELGKLVKLWRELEPREEATK
jgi:hypothetical protein